MFATTHWSVVIEAGSEHSQAAAAALEKLCSTYWYPVYAEIRRRGHPPHDAQDLAQDFFACLLRRHSFANADKSRGRFRSYLLGALNYFLADQYARQQTEKRGGHCLILSLDALDPEARYLEDPAAADQPETLFDRRWKESLLEEALARLKLEYAEAKKEKLFESLKPFLALDVPPGGYDQPSRELGMTPSTLAVAVYRMRQRYGELVRSIVAETVANPAEADDELRQLFA